MITSREPNVINVISQNMLHDVRRTRDGLILPQDDRVGSLAATLTNFPALLDIVGVQEAHKSKKQHNGEVLAGMCDYGPGFWVQHNEPVEGKKRGRMYEYVGLFGALVTHAESVELGDNRRAIMSVIADVAFVNLHLRSGMGARYLRREQAHYLTEAIEEYDNAVVFGDLNEPPIRQIALARKELARAGFRSVFPLTGQKCPITSPIPSYVEASMDGRSRLEAHFVKRGWSIDDILVRGDRINVRAAGVLDSAVVRSSVVPDTLPREGSDHEGIWATLDLTPRND